MSRGSTVLLFVGVVVAIAGVAFIALDALGKGDSSSIDYKDVGLVVVGVLLAAIGAALGRRRSAPAPPAPPVPPA